MDSQGGEGSQLPVATSTAVVDQPLNATVEPNVAVSNPLDKLEGVVAAAQQAAAASTTPQTPAETPKVQFENQFGSGPATPTPPVDDNATVPGLIDTALANLGTTPPAETPSSSVASLDPNINTVADLLAKGPQVVETQSEVKLPSRVQEFLDSVLSATEKYRASEEEKVASS